MHQRTPGARLGGGGAAGQRLVPGRGVGEEGSQHGGSGAPERSEHLLLTAQCPVSQARARLQRPLPSLRMPGVHLLPQSCSPCLLSSLWRPLPTPGWPRPAAAREEGTRDVMDLSAHQLGTSQLVTVSGLRGSPPAAGTQDSDRPAQLGTRAREAGAPVECGPGWETILRRRKLGPVLCVISCSLPGARTW